jgi:hypothetical protein
MCGLTYVRKEPVSSEEACTRWSKLDESQRRRLLFFCENYNDAELHGQEMSKYSHEELNLFVTSEWDTLPDLVQRLMCNEFRVTGWTRFNQETNRVERVAAGW